jgi:hypothetical protein
MVDRVCIFLGCGDCIKNKKLISRPSKQEAVSSLEWVWPIRTAGQTMLLQVWRPNSIAKSKTPSIIGKRNMHKAATDYSTKLLFARI